MTVLLWPSVFAAGIDRSSEAGGRRLLIPVVVVPEKSVNQSIINANTRTGAIEITLEQGRIRFQHLVLRY